MRDYARTHAFVEGGPLDGESGHEVMYPTDLPDVHYPEEVVWKGHLYRFKLTRTGRGAGPVYEYVKTLGEDESAP